jgi:multiple antibiotic resistance protein
VGTRLPVETASPAPTNSGMLTTMPNASFIVALTTFFATIGPADLALVFAALTPKNSAVERRVFALRGVLVATGILLFFAVFGNALLTAFGITLPALQTAGGALLFLISLDMVFARHSGGTGTTSEEEAEARTRSDLSVFPLAMPLIAGPGSISGVILLISNTGGDQLKELAVIAAMLVILGLAYLSMLAAIPIQRIVGLTGLTVVQRIVGVLLAALSVQFIFDGIKASHLLGG